MLNDMSKNAWRMLNDMSKRAWKMLNDTTLREHGECLMIQH